MSKAVVHSVSPQQCERIAAGEQSILLSKTRPKLKTPFKDYIYCTKHKYYHLYDLRKVSNGILNLSVVEHNKTSLVADGFLNGKVIGEFVCDEIATLKSDDDWNADPPQKVYVFDKMPSDYVLLDFDICLTNKELLAYGKGKNLYGWHISDLVIYDKPRGLWDFARPCDGCDKIGTSRCTEEISPCRATILTHPPQSWQFVQSIMGGRLHFEEV